MGLAPGHRGLDAGHGRSGVCQPPFAFRARVRPGDHFLSLQRPAGHLPARHPHPPRQRNWRRGRARRRRGHHPGALPLRRRLHLVRGGGHAGDLRGGVYHQSAGKFAGHRPHRCMSSPRVTPPAASTDGLLRALGPLQSTAIVVGTLIGTGIFFVSSDMIKAVHSIGWILLAWVVGGFLSLAGALAYAELGTLRPQAGGEYVYLRDGLGPLFGFLFGWGMFWIVRPASVATIGAGFALAAKFLWPALAQPLIPGWTALSGKHVLGAGVIALVTAINYFGVRYGGSV